MKACDTLCHGKVIPLWCKPVVIPYTLSPFESFELTGLVFVKG